MSQRDTFYRAGCGSPSHTKTCILPCVSRKRGVSRSKANVFRELGFPDSEAEHLRVRADLLIALQETVARKGMKQAEIARILGISQPRTSDLLRGRLDLFSSDALIDYLARLGIGVRLTFGRSTKPGRVA